MSKEAEIIDALRRASEQTTANVLQILGIALGTALPRGGEGSSQSGPAPSVRERLFDLAHLFLDGYNNSLRVHARYFDQITAELRELARSPAGGGREHALLELSGSLGEEASSTFKVVNEYSSAIAPIFSFSELESIAGKKRFSPRAEIVKVGEHSVRDPVIPAGERSSFKVIVALDAKFFASDSDYTGTLYVHQHGAILAEIELRLRVNEPRPSRKRVKR